MNFQTKLIAIITTLIAKPNKYIVMHEQKSVKFTYDCQSSSLLQPMFDSNFFRATELTMVVCVHKYSRSTLWVMALIMLPLPFSPKLP